MKKWLIGLSIFTSAGIILYWITVFMGLFPVEELVPGYTLWFMAFPLPDFWIAVNALLAAVLLTKDRGIAVPFGIVSGSSMIFLSLYAGAYGWNSGLICHKTIDTYIEIAIKIYTFSVGLFFIFSYWKLRTVLGRNQGNE